MTPALIIRKKRDRQTLTTEEISFFIRGLGTGDVADYQATALLMAIYLNGMNADETMALTRAMLESGERYDLTHIQGPKSDKHSTGGIGDKVSLILAPLAAACGLRVPMMSGRGLGHSGGTLDKLEAISGFDVRLNRERFETVLREVGCAMIGQTDRIAPADKKLYALRDVTGTVECIPLITASILSKKLAEGTESLVMDVKFGNGAFMKTKAEAQKLAKSIEGVTKKMKLPCATVLSNMDQPLGYAAGNALEVLESVEVLTGRRALEGELVSDDLKDLTLHLCAQMIVAGKVRKSLKEARKLAKEKLENGSAWQVFKRLVAAQGGSLAQVENPLKLPLSQKRVLWKARKSGFVSGIDTLTVGLIIVEMGGGRKKAADTIDPKVGLVFHKKLGAKVAKGEPLVTVFAPESPSFDTRKLEELEQWFHRGVTITPRRKTPPKLY
ncbi:MAG: thymidine phosphorylase [Bacteriovoracia bacterium]